MPGEQHERTPRLCACVSPEGRLEGLCIASLVHDIGKMAVPIEILSSPGALNPAQPAMVHEHAAAGYEILKTISFDAPVADMVRQHHERLDGSGYPDATGRIDSDARKSR